MDWQERIENKIDKIDLKLDNHLSRLSRAEEAISWMKGHIKIVTTLGVTIVTILIGAIVNGYF